MMPVPSNFGSDETSPTGQCSNWGDPANLGRFIQQGTMVAAVCSSNSIAVLPITDDQLEWIGEGTQVRLCCGCNPRQIHYCKVNSIISLRDAKATRRLIEDTRRLLQNGEAKGRETTYAAIVELPEQVPAPLYGTVDAVFLAPSQTITSLCKRWLRENLRWLAD